MTAKQSQPEDMEKTTDPRGLRRFYICPNWLAQAGSIWAVVVCLLSVCHLSVCCVTYPNGQSPNLSTASGYVLDDIYCQLCHQGQQPTAFVV